MDSEANPLRLVAESQDENRRQRRADLIREYYDRVAPERDKWISRNAYFHDEDSRFARFLVPPGLKVLDLGCGTGQMLANLKPCQGVGIDISAKMVDAARRNYAADRHPNLSFEVGDIEEPETLDALDGPFDVIILSDTVGLLDDVEATLASLHNLSSNETRIVVAYYSWLWTPTIALAELFGAKMPQIPLNRLGPEDVSALLELADFDVIKRDWRQLLPKRLFGAGPLINRSLAVLPLIRRFCVRHYVVARSRRHAGLDNPSTTVVIPCRNERGNIAPAVDRLPEFCDEMEILFVEGHSSDGTREEIERVIARHPERDIKLLLQDGEGKGNAVRAAFDAARGDILMILDADLTVPPEALPKFYNALVSGKGEFINGTRLVYPMEKRAMRPLNLIANFFFSMVFSWLLNQRFTDTLCGTKVLTKAHYLDIAKNRAYFGNFDPFGDFDLIFGASKLNLKVIEIPIRYAERTYGSTQISRFRHGVLLLRMVVFAFRKLKAF
ncbi:MAG: glycosyltransferase [Alphaproteobacteria bacterium]|jgi:SAM-dependent methyltransferase|nr:glycosyltransferase [Alphaproteobacteria bacterium]|tara:strand:- start:1275 stop:2771 length:1497 start_codon:yes stop_codon:yes gene_type:complete